MEKQIFTVLSQIRKAVWGEDTRPRPVIMYHLAEQNPYARVQYPDGDEYRIFEDGQTAKKIAGLDIPWPGCPHPEAIFTLSTSAFVYRNRKRIPLFLVALLALASLQFLIATIPGAPSAAWFVDYFAAVMNTVLVLLAALCIVAVVFYNFGKGIDIQLGKDEMSGLLDAGAMSLHPDILIMSRSETDNGQEFADRIKTARLDMSPRGQYLVVFTFRCPAAIIVRVPDSGSQEVFGRATLCKDIPGWQQEICPPTRFEKETFAEFYAYVNCFCDQFPGWSMVDKMRHGNGARDVLKDWTSTLEVAARKVAVFALLFFASFAVQAQSVQPIPTNAGQSIFRSVPDSAKLEAYKLEMMQGKAQIGHEIRPRLAFVMWTFHNWVVPCMFLVGLLAWFWAKAAFRESEHDNAGNVIFGIGIANGGHYARRIVFLLAAMIALVEIADTMIISFFASENLWWAAIKSVGYAVAGMYIVNWITPNPQVSANAGGMGRIGGPNTFKQLNG